jgi:choline kinase
MDYPPTLLLRIYGPSSDALISREEELRILHVLSTEYGLGPKVYGTFENGRIEQFFPSRALHADELRDPTISKGIARRMRELHSVDLRLLGYDKLDPMVWQCLAKWIPIAEEVLESLAKINDTWAKWAEAYGLHKVRQEVERYAAFVEGDAGKGKGVVFARASASCRHKRSAYDQTMTRNTAIS